MGTTRRKSERALCQKLALLVSDWTVGIGRLGLIGQYLQAASGLFDV